MDIIKNKLIIQNEKQVLVISYASVNRRGKFGSTDLPPHLAIYVSKQKKKRTNRPLSTFFIIIVIRPSYIFFCRKTTKIPYVRWEGEKGGKNFHLMSFLFFLIPPTAETNI